MTRTKGLKAEPEDGVGDDREEVSNQEDDEDKIDINDGTGQSCAGQSNVDKGRDICVRVRVSQVDSLGTVLSIHEGLYTFGLCTGHGLCARSTEPCL